MDLCVMAIKALTAEHGHGIIDATAQKSHFSS